MTQNNLLFRRRIITFLVVLSLFAPIIVNVNSVIAQNNAAPVSDLIIEEAPQKGNDLSIEADSVNVTDYSGFDDNYGQINDIFILGNYMYVALGADGLAIYNITNLNPEFIVQWDNYTCTYVYSANDFLYLSNNTGFYVLDATNINNLALLTNWTGASTIRDIYAEGDFVFFTDNDGIFSVNITDYTNPIVEDSYLNSQLREFHVNDGIAYVRDSDRVRIFNITDPTNIDYIAGAFASVNDLFYLADTLYLCDSSFTYLYNVTDPNSPTYLSLYNFNNTGTNNIVVVGNYLYIEEGDGIVVVDISNKSEPLYFNEFRETITMTDIYTYGNYLFLRDSNLIEILDVNNPLDIISLWIDQIYGSTTDIFIDGTTLYAADDTALEIIDISNPLNPVEIGKYTDEDETIASVFVRNNYAYIYEPGFGMKILDVTDPTNVLELGNITFGGSFQDIYVSDEYAYIAQDTNGLLVIDIFYPDYPQQALQYEEYDEVQGVEKMDDYLYIAAGEYFHILDMSNPFKPTEVGNWTRLNANYYGIFLTEDYAYLLCDEGIDIIDVTDPVNPVKVGQFFNYNLPWKLFVDGQYIYLLDFISGIEIFDASNIAHPRRVSTFELDTLCWNIWARNGYIYLAGFDEGVIILITEPLLTVKSGIGPFTYVCGLAFFSVLGLLLRKKKRKK